MTQLEDEQDPFASWGADLTILVLARLRPDPKLRAVAEFEGKARGLALKLGDLLAEEMAKKDGRNVLFLARLMQMHPPVYIEMFERPLDGDATAIGKIEMRRPWGEAHLANL